jgi:hypothetical protein
MKMEEEGKISLSNTFGELIPDYADTELKDVTVLKANLKQGSQTFY